MFLFRRRASLPESQPVVSTTETPDNPHAQQNGASPGPRRQSANVAAAVQERLAQEVLRKLRLAIASEDKESRDIICNEVFADITSELNAAARESTGALYRRWFEALAPYFCRAPADSEALLAACNRLWGQAFAAPIYALLLHQWLLVHPEAGGAERRLKHVNVLVSGARQVFLGDVESGSMAFKSLHAFVLEQVVLSPSARRLDAMPGPARDALFALTAAFAPYYVPPSALSVIALDIGPDVLIDRVVDLMAGELRAELAVLRYVRALTALQGTRALLGLRTSTRVRLQGELYALTQPGGPRYASRAVNREAFAALDVLFPHGRRTRRLINLAFRFLHPQEWPWVWWDATWAVASGLGRWILTGGGAIRWAWWTARDKRTRLVERNEQEWDE
jgi:hypothetical protein